MLIFSLFLMESYLSPAKHRYLGWMGWLSECVECSSSQTAIPSMWDEGRNQHNMTSHSLTLKPNLIALCGGGLCCLLLSKPLWSHAVRNEVVWTGWQWISIPVVLFPFFVWSATVSLSCSGALPLIGGRLSCQEEKRLEEEWTYRSTNTCCVLWLDWKLGLNKEKHTIVLQHNIRILLFSLDDEKL